MNSRKDIKVEYNLKGLEKMKKALESDAYIKLGIFGNNSSRSGKTTNATIGMVHEFGSVTKNIPPRSFLRMPLAEKSKELMKTIKAQSDMITKDISQGKLFNMLEKIGLKCEAIVQEAFASAGFGKWEELKHRVGTPLIDTGELRKSIVSKVEKNG